MDVVRLFLVLMAAMVAAACATVSVETPSGYRASYTRIWDQEIQGLSIHHDANGTVAIELQKQSSSTEALVDIIVRALGVPK